MQLDYYIIMCTLQSLTLTSFSRKMAMSEVSRSRLGSKVLGQHAEGPWFNFAWLSSFFKVHGHGLIVTLTPGINALLLLRLTLLLILKPNHCGGDWH